MSLITAVEKCFFPDFFIETASSTGTSVPSFLMPASSIGFPETKLIPVFLNLKNPFFFASLYLCGTIFIKLCPSISFSVYPNIFSAPGFHIVMFICISTDITPSIELLMSSRYFFSLSCNFFSTFLRLFICNFKFIFDSSMSCIIFNIDILCCSLFSNWMLNSLVLSSTSFSRCLLYVSTSSLDFFRLFVILSNARDSCPISSFALVPTFKSRFPFIISSVP